MTPAPAIPDWLDAAAFSPPDDPVRSGAFAAFRRVGAPGRRVEGWRWSDLAHALSRGWPSHSAAVRHPLADLQAHTITVSTDGGGALPDGVEGLDVRTGPPPPLAFEPEAHPMAALAAAASRAEGTLLIDVRRPVSLPLHLAFADGPGGPLQAYVKLVLHEGASVHLVESHAVGGGANVVVDCQAGPHTRLVRTLVQTAAPGAVAVSFAHIVLEAGARFHQTVLASGGRLARVETRVLHSGEGAEAHLAAAYHAAGGRHVDLTSLVEHRTAGAVTRQRVKGAVRAGGRGVFQGKFFVDRGAQKTDADMRHDALILDPAAEVDAKPELEIYADDVSCAHGNAIGALDPDALFYSRQRGMDEDSARAMLTMSFLLDIIESADASVADLLRAEVGRWMGPE